MIEPIECPFCGHEIDRFDGIYSCDMCECTWYSLEEIEQDREGPPDPLDRPIEWSDVFTEDRTS